MSLIGELATEKITINHKGNIQSIEKANVQPKKIFIPGDQFSNNNVYEVKVAIGDEITHTNKAGIEEKYEVTSVIYVDKDSSFDEEHIQISIKSLKKLQTANYASQSFLMQGNNGNINILSPNSSQTLNFEYNKLDEETKEKLNNLSEAIKSKDKYKFQSAVSFLLDKGFDLGLGLVIAKLTGQI